MNTFRVSLTAALLTGSLALAGPIPQATPRNVPTRLAHFEMGAYLAKEGTKLNVNVDKQLGGQVEVQLKDAGGNLIFQKMMSALDTKARLRLDLSELSDGDYVLKVTNGLEMIVRDIKIATKNPAPTTRSLTILGADYPKPEPL